MNCLKFIVKHLLFIFNLIFAIVALVIIGAGSYAFHYVTHNEVLTNITSIAEVSVLQNFNEDILKYICIAIIALGCLIFVISFCGCCGSIAENKCLIVSYAVVMLILGGACIFVLVTRSGYFDKAERAVERTLNETFYTPQYPIEDESIHAVQYTIKCCGTRGPEFYNGTTFNADNLDPAILDIIYEKLNISGVGLISPSCCSTLDLRAFLDDPKDYIVNTFQCTQEDVYEEGCVTKVLGYFDVVEKYFTIILIVVTAVVALAFIFGVYMCCAIKSKKEKKRYY
ncbi:23 kDa integral membrane protein [Amyelois transitella]|uniref:23 kDa integral membrane protein n=1 Tax=Amyelois transitella TaxID=680683 RepID=UPI00298FE666|nr:23 kDa integral membrane protein [Amyelois transitella]